MEPGSNAVARRTRRLEILSKTSARLLAASDPDRDVLPPLFAELSEIGVDCMFSFTAGDDGGFRLTYHAGVPAEAMSISVAFDQTVCGLVASTGVPVYIADVQGCERPSTALIKALGIGAYDCEPLMAGERRLGTLSFGTLARNGFSAEDLSFFRAVAGLVAIARERARTETALRRSQARLDEALAAGRIGAWERDLTTGKVTASAQHKLNFGLPPEADITFEQMQAMRHPKDHEVVTDALRRAIEERHPYDVETRVIWPDGSVRWLISRGRAVFDEAGQPERFLGLTLDITDRKQAESVTERLGRIVEESMSEAYVFDARTLRFIQVNRGARENLGYTMDELKDLTPMDIKPEFTRERFEGLVLPLRTGTSEQIDFETVHRRKDGSLYDVAVRLQLMRTGVELVFFAAIADITERKQAEERLKLVAREMDHRANNLLSVVQAVIRLTQAPSLPAFIEAVEGRIHALSHAHALLSASRWVGADLERLIAEETAAYQGAERVRVSGPPVTLDPNAAQSIAMAIHELLTNAAKYGALSTPDGGVSIEWQVSEASGLKLRWAETGGPPVEVPQSGGFGTSVIESLIRRHLGGEMRFEWMPAGLVCEMTMPLQPATERPVKSSRRFG